MKTKRTIDFYNHYFGIVRIDHIPPGYYQHPTSKIERPSDLHRRTKLKPTNLLRNSSIKAISTSMNNIEDESLIANKNQHNELDNKGPSDIRR